jgi:hypothetical protein
MIGLDIAKHVFQVHGIDAQEKVVVRKQVRRSQVLRFFRRTPALPCWVRGLRHIALLGQRTRYAWHCNGANKAAVRLARLGLPFKMMIGGVAGWIDEGFSLTASVAGS